jgi:hypothetical protein
MPDEPTTYLSPQAPTPDPYLYQPPPTPAAPAAPAKRLSPVLAGVVGLALGAVLGGGGVWVTHSSSSTSTGAPTGQMGNVNGQGGPGGTAPTGAPPTGTPPTGTPPTGAPAG